MSCVKFNDTLTGWLLKDVIDLQTKY